MSSMRLFLGCAIVTLLLVSSSASAQTITWAKAFGGSGDDGGYGVAVDDSGNIYMTGTFTGTADFDPGPGTAELVSAGGQDIYILKLNHAGELLWAKSVGGAGDEGGGVSVDASGNVWIGGWFQGTADFDPGPGTFLLTTNALLFGPFVLKLSSSGDFLWALQFEASYMAFAGPPLVDPSGNLHISGWLQGSVDLDPGPGEYSVGAPSFLIKLSAAGEFIWGGQIDSICPSADSSKWFAISPSGDAIYLAGTFCGYPVDVDPGPGEYLLSADFTRVVIVKYSLTDYEVLWALQFVGDSVSQLASAAVDPTGNVYITGEFEGTIDFDPGPGTFNLTAGDVGDSAFLVKLDSSGGFLWAVGIDAPSWISPYGVAADVAGTVYTSGSFYGTVDFDPGPGVHEVTGTGVGSTPFDGYVLRLNSLGQFEGVLTVGGDTANTSAAMVTLDGSGTPYVAGTFSGTDVQSGLVASGGTDAFLLKLWTGPDVDGDGYSPEAGDCDDTNAEVYPGAPEICDEFDNDCDGFVDLNDSDLEPTVDTDEDGLSDCEEVYLVNGVLSVRDLGADRLVPDIFVEVDFMSCDADGDGVVGPKGDCTSFHPDHAPRQESLRHVETAFARDRNNDGRPDIALHFVTSERVPHLMTVGSLNDLEMLVFGTDMIVGSVPDPEVICNPANAVYFGDPSDRSDPSTCHAIIEAKSWVFRHLLIGHDFPGVKAGVAQAGCPSFSFSVYTEDLASFASIIFARWRDILPTSVDNEIVSGLEGTIMHELGHTLGLLHGGSDDVNCKPNYLSVMSSSRLFNTAGFGTLGVTDPLARINRELDYSPLLPDLDEEALMENAGVAGPSGMRTAYWNGTLLPEVNNTLVGPSSGPIDWDWDSVIDSSPVEQNVTRIKEVGCHDLQEEVLAGHDDWARVAQCIALPRGSAAEATAGVTDFVVPPDEPTLINYLDGSLGSEDVDSDTIGNSQDLCPLFADVDEVDSDGDGAGDNCDCLPMDGSNWDTPSEALDVRSLGKETLSWTAPSFVGSTILQYDTIRSDVASSFTAGTCVESNDVDIVTTDASLPDVGEAFHYLVRARNVCPSGEGPLGTMSDGTPRTGVSCP